MKWLLPLKGTDLSEGEAEAERILKKGCVYFQNLKLKLGW